MTKQSVGEIVDDLVARGYAQRVPDPADRRAKLICLTDKGSAPNRSPSASSPRSKPAGPSATVRERMALLREALEEIAAAEAPDAVPELAREELADA